MPGFDPDPVERVGAGRGVGGEHGVGTDPDHRAVQMAEQRGIKIKVFSSGIYKGMGVPGTSLTAEQETYLQDHVETLAQEFYDHIRACLGDVPDEAMQGQMLRAQEAVNIGFANDIVKSLDDLKTFLG